VEYYEYEGHNNVGPVGTSKTFAFKSFSMGLLAAWFEETNKQVIIDETGLTGNYDFALVTGEPALTYTLTSFGGAGHHRVTLNEALKYVGLELVPAKRKVSAIYTEVTESEAKIKAHPLWRGYKKSSVPWSVLRDNDRRGYVMP
jgi:uncharacterized protein (TIGR03435 family)